VTEDDVVVQLCDAFGAEMKAGGVLAGLVALDDEGAHLVHGHDALAAVGELAGGVAGEELGRVAILPSAVVLERLRQVPVVERAEGLDAGRKQGIEQALVEVDAGGVGLAGSGGEDACPRDMLV